MVKVSEITTEHHGNPWECLCDICENNLINNLEYARSKILHVSYTSKDIFVNSFESFLQRIYEIPGQKNSKEYRVKFTREFSNIVSIILGNMDIINQDPRLRYTIIKKCTSFYNDDNINPKYVPLDLLCLILLDVIINGNV